MEADSIRSVGTNQKLKRIRLPLILALREMKNPTDTLPKRVLFFGTRFLLVHNLAPKIYVEYANRRLDFIRRNYFGMRSNLPAASIRNERGESIELKRILRLENGGEPAKFYFLERFAQIEAVFFVSSTVSRKAMTFGLNAYAFWCCFPFTEIASRFFERLMGAVPLNSKIRDFTRRPIELSVDANN